MIPSVKKPGGNTRGLLAYLYGPGRHDEHLDPHIVASFSPRGLPDPGRDQDATLTQLGQILDAPVKLRNEGFGKKVTDHVWHCSVRAAPGDRYLSDAEWGEVARRIVHAAGIAPDGDPLFCRWIAVRHADDHIHILATTVREDGRRPKIHNCGMRAQAEVRVIEKELGLHQVAPSDRTGERRPTQAEMHKAARLGWEQTSRAWLQKRIRAAIPHAASVEELLAYLEADGVEIKIRRYPSGDLQGYAAGRPGDVKADGEQVYISGSKIAPDLSLPKLQARLDAGKPEEYPTARRNRPSTSWQRATDALDTLHDHLTDNGSTGEEAQAQITALGEIIDATAQAGPAELRDQLRAASREFARAQRSRIRADHHTAAGLRQAARDIVSAGDGPDGSAFAVLLTALVWSAILASRWHQAQGHQQQAEAARITATHLQATYDQAAAGQLAALTHRQPTPEITNTFAGAVRSAVPDHADGILADPNWPALASVLADAHAAGHHPRTLLTKQPPAANWTQPGSPPKSSSAASSTPAATPPPTPEPKLPASVPPPQATPPAPTTRSPQRPLPTRQLTHTAGAEAITDLEVRGP